MKPPCKDCTDRAVCCHSVCEQYKAYKEYNDSLKNNIKARKEIDGFLVEQSIRRHKYPRRKRT